jgi:hypothetical protein
MSSHAAGQPHIAESSSASFHHLLTVPVPLALVDEDAHILAANSIGCWRLMPTCLRCRAKRLPRAE